MSTTIELPQYQCHKKVHALKIKDIQHKPNPDTTGRSTAISYGAVIVPEEPRYAAFEVPAEFVTKHNPQPGGYYVRYEDGYESYSPAEAFESGYTPIDQVREGDKKETAQKVSIDPIEQEIIQKGLTAPRITMGDIEANIASEHYFTAAEGVAGEASLRNGLVVVGDKTPPVVLSLLTFCVLVLHNGDTVVGKSTCTFNAEIGREIARKDAINQLWPLMGYELRSNIARGEA